MIDVIIYDDREPMTGEELEDGMGWPRGTVANHPPTDECQEPECWVCGFRDCPEGDLAHYDKDGCPSCPRPNRDCHQVNDPIPYALEPIELPEFREGLHFAPNDEYGYGV